MTQTVTWKKRWLRRRQQQQRQSKVQGGKQLTTLSLTPNKQVRWLSQISIFLVELVQILLSHFSEQTRLNNARFKQLQNEKTYSQEKLKKMSSIHKSVQAEFISTEETYVKSLELLSCKLIQPLRAAMQKGVNIPQDILTNLANNVETLCVF